ncbi:ferredoxin [uncultured Clostridium sp.]|uniref:ferredoxin n=1 Tax=uncultured Clostridium sp. TaxID=59620 RepID=UPI002637F1CA|nr:ferredoxin [uncultured Clostridium sp.]
MKVLVDQDLCISCGLCEKLCNEVFTFDDYNLAVAINTEIPKKHEIATEKAVRQCPVNAITEE